MFDGIREVADANSKHLVLSVGSIDGRRDSFALDSLLQSRVDVIIATGLLLPDEEVRRFNKSVSIVSVARQIEGVDSVTSDNYVGASTATEHLLGLGHRRIVFLANPPTDGYLERRLGYKTAMEHAGLEPWIIESQYSRRQAAEDIASALALPQVGRPTAVFAHNDQAALGVLDAMASMGLSAPHDVSVVGYDNTQISSAPGTALTTVDIHGADLGRVAARTALARLANAQSPPALDVSEPTLVVRSTTGPSPHR